MSAPEPLDPGNTTRHACPTSERFEAPFPPSSVAATLALGRLTHKNPTSEQSLPNVTTRIESPLELLTPREMQVLYLLSQGQSNSQIARSLVISQGTAKLHVHRIITKLGVSDRTQAAILAISSGVFA
jgi:DNA-binding NarL/FixJ family response regulator